MAENISEKVGSILHTDKLGNEPEWRTVQVHKDELVEPKWQGTGADQHEMRILGRVQVLRVSRYSGNVYWECVAYNVPNSATSASFPS